MPVLFYGRLPVVVLVAHFVHSAVKVDLQVGFGCLSLVRAPTSVRDSRGVLFLVPDFPMNRRSAVASEFSEETTVLK